jgi:bla regulator protein blaR1
VPPRIKSNPRIATALASALAFAVACPCPPLKAQSSEANSEIAAGGKMSFDVASVRLAANPDADPASNVPLGPMVDFSPTGGLFRASNFLLIQYIAFAYKFSPEEGRAFQSQLPKWADTNVYDIVARANGNPTKDQFRLMMQSLLASRFKLAVHYETKAMPVLALMLDKPGKLGPYLRTHKDDEIPCAADSASQPTAFRTTAAGFPVQCGTLVRFPMKNSGITRIGARALPSSALANFLITWSESDRPVVDDTGLGLIDFMIEFTPNRMTNKGLEYDPDAPTFVEALKQQLGLKFEPRRAPVRSMILDHIEQPSPN